MSGDAPPAAAHQSTGSAVPGLDDATVDSLASRLADDASMALPGSLSGQVQDDAPARSKRVEYLHALLQRDPGVFLERHGEHLDRTDLAAFEGLRSDYEVDFHIRLLSSRIEPAQSRLTPQVRNRRLAKLNRLIDEGEFFSNEAMRARQPLLHLQYVGQYLPAAPAARAPTEGGHPLSSSILQDVEEAQTLERFRRDKEAQDAIEADSSDEEAYPEDRRAEVPQAAADAGDGAGPIAAAAGGSPAAGEAAAAEERPAQEAGGQQGEDAEDQGEDAENRPEAAPFVHIPQEEQAQLQADFLELMHQRFLAGEDEAFVNYGQIDADAALDDDWADERRQDAEDAYFDDM